MGELASGACNGSPCWPGPQDPLAGRSSAKGEAGPFLELSAFGQSLPRMHCSRWGPTLGWLCRCQHPEKRDVPLSLSSLPSAVVMVVIGMIVEIIIIYYLF